MCTVNKHLLVFLYNSKLKILFKDCPLQCFIDVEIVINILIFQSSKKNLFSHGSYIYFKKIATIMIHFNSRSEKKYDYTKYLKCPEAWLQKSKKVYKEKKKEKERKKVYSFLNFLWPNLKWTESARKNIEVPKQTTIIRILSGSPDMNNSEIEDWDTMHSLLK